MKHYILAFLFAGSVLGASAQQIHTSSLYEMQGGLFNPSLAGVDQKVTLGTTYRTQWSGIDGSPKTSTVFGSVDLPQHQIGLGGYLYSDKTGPTSRTGATVAFAKHIETGKGGIFSLGLEARFQQFSLDRAKLSSTLGADPALGTSDNRSLFDAGFGLSYTGKHLQIGASVSQLVQSKLDFYTGNLTTTESARLYRHYYFNARYKWNVDNNTTITPHVLVTYLPNAPVDLQAGFHVEHNEVFWWGVAMRKKQSFILSAGVNINKKFTVGYAFDIYNSPLSIYDAGSFAHELVLRYNIMK